MPELAPNLWSLGRTGWSSHAATASRVPTTIAETAPRKRRVSMQTRSRGVASLVGIAAVALIVSACGGGSSGGGGGTAQKGDTGFKKISANQSGTPTKGGTLNVLGTGDVDYLDPNISYYTIGYSVARLYSRQLYSYPAELGKQTELRNDIATGNAEVSSDGLTYKVTIKQGVKGNSR